MTYYSSWRKMQTMMTTAECRVTTYKVRELDETPLQGSFYSWDLQKVHVDAATYFRVEKVLKRAKDKLFVKWKGYPSKYNSWIYKKYLR